MAESLGLLSVLEQSIGVYGTAPTCYLSAMARVPGLAIDHFDTAVAERRLVRVRAMRHSVYTLPREMVGPVTAASRSVVRRLNIDRGVPPERFEKVAAAIDQALADGPLPASEIRRIVDPEGELGGLFSAVLAQAADRLRLVRTTTTGSWRSDRFSYARWSDWLPEVDPDRVADAEARRMLAGWYVAAYGPVELKDVKWWTGWTKEETDHAVDGIDLDQAGVAMSLLTGTRLLPVWDVLMVAYRNRDRLLDPSYSPLAYDRFGNATSVVLREGRVIGQWDLGSTDSPLNIKVAPFTEWPDATWDDVEREAHRIGELVGAGSIVIHRVDEPTDLLDSSRNRFLAPLSKR